MMAEEEPDLKKQKLEEGVNSNSSSSEEETKHKDEVKGSSSSSSPEEETDLKLKGKGKDSSSDSEDGYDSEKEFRKYSEQIEASDGFDVDYFPDSSSCGMIVPVYCPEDGEDAMEPSFLDRITTLTRDAIEWYNEKNESDYEYVSLVKANAAAVAGFMLYITFKAKLPDCDAETFQTRVYDGIEEVEIDFVRLKPTRDAY